jgi:hypothetical protein
MSGRAEGPDQNPAYFGAKPGHTQNIRVGIGDGLQSALTGDGATGIMLENNDSGTHRNQVTA